MIKFNNTYCGTFCGTNLLYVGVEGEQVITELVKFGLRIMYREWYSVKRYKLS